MKRTDALDAAPGGLFTDGDPSVPIPATVLDASWLNTLQEEVVGVVLMAGLTLDPLDDTQLYTALELLIMGAMAAHLAAADPHPQYLTMVDVTGSYQALAYQLGLTF